MEIANNPHCGIVIVSIFRWSPYSCAAETPTKYQNDWLIATARDCNEYKSIIKWLNRLFSLVALTPVSRRRAAGFIGSHETQKQCKDSLNGSNTIISVYVYDDMYTSHNLYGKLTTRLRRKCRPLGDSVHTYRIPVPTAAASSTGPWTWARRSRRRSRRYFEEFMHNDVDLSWYCNLLNMFQMRCR